MRKLRLVYLVPSVLIATALVWEFASPWLALKGMRDAARAQDSQRLAQYIDFPKLRSNVSDQIVQLVEKRLPAPAYSNLAARVGMRVIIDPVVEAIVSPKALSVALSAAPIAAGSKPKAARDCGVLREGLRQFRLRCAPLPNGQGDLLFERNGFGWKLVGIDLPADYGNQVPQIPTQS